MNGLPVPPQGGPPPGGISGETRGPDQRLGRNQRLIRSAHFDEAFAQGKKRVGRFMVMWVRTGDDASLRLGVISSRKVGGAVQRVKARRRLREVFRRNRYLLRGPYDVLLVARATVVRAPAADVEKDFIALCKQSGLWSTE